LFTEPGAGKLSLEDFTMQLLNVKIVTPDGRAFTAQINPQVEYQSLLRDIVKAFGLPKSWEEYELLLNALKLDNNVTIRVSERNARLMPSNIRLVE
jgi:hypothetical protein